MGSQVAPTRTPWGSTHLEIRLRMPYLLKACGVRKEHVRIRMTAHAIIASGWRQAIWNYNAWGVKAGRTWRGDWYSMDTIEADSYGAYYDVPDEAWRAFSSWQQAVDDYNERISPKSERYAKAYHTLQDPNSSLDGEFWADLGKGGYYTDKNLGAAEFASVCRGVRNALATATTEDIRAAKAWVATQPTGGMGLLWPIVGIIISGAAGWWFLKDRR